MSDQLIKPPESGVHFVSQVQPVIALEVSLDRSPGVITQEVGEA